MRDILLHVHDNPKFDQGLEAALTLARSGNGHLHCLHAVPLLSYLSFSGFATISSIEAKLKAWDERQDALEASIKDRLGREDVPWSYERIMGDVVDTIFSQAALSDLVVVSRGDPDQKKGQRERLAFLGDLVTRLRTPIFIPGDRPTNFDATGPALIAWDGSYEAANAVRGSIQLISKSSSVTVVRVSERKRELFPNTRILQYLSRHGVEAELIEEPYTEDWVGKILILQADQKGAGYIVAGGYGHSRVGEWIFGGTTRELLTSCPVGVVMAH